MTWLAFWLMGWMAIAGSIAFTVALPWPECLLPTAYGVYMAFHNLTPFREQQRDAVEIRESIVALAGSNGGER